MKKPVSCLVRYVVIVLFAVALLPGLTHAQDHRLGVGVNYWTTLKSISSDIDRDGFSYLPSYQYRPSLFGFEAAVEFMPDRFGERAIAPQAWLIVGQAFYLAAGMGITYHDKEWADKPFFGIKGGLDMNLLPGIYLDISANYRFNDKDDLKDDDKKIDTDTIFLGAALRLAF